MLLPYPSRVTSLSVSRCAHTHHRGRAQVHRLTFFNTKPPFNPKCPISVGVCRTQKSMADHNSFNDGNVKSESNMSSHSKDSTGKTKTQEKNFWGAVSLIIGTAVGPGMLGLPAATTRSGPIPSTIVILLSWVYVISSIVLVAELSFSTMDEEKANEVSFTTLATKALGSGFDAFVALVYASLSFSLLVVCVSGIGSIVSQWFPLMNSVMANALFPFAVGILMAFFPFKAIDASNRFLCFVMLISITSLVAIGFSAARVNLINSFKTFHASSWSLSSILPAIPVIVLTFGFHVITPFICKIAGNVNEARKAILFGGSVPLIMVLSWNLIVLGLSGNNSVISSENPISLLLSVSKSALPAVQGFAFSALATSFIGYAVSLPKQILDTLDLIFGRNKSNKYLSSQSQVLSNGNGNGRVGLVTYSGGNCSGITGKVIYSGAAREDKLMLGTATLDPYKILITLLILGVPVLLASFFQSTFSRALDFAGVYANCFLFGILPPLMTFIYQSKRKLRQCILPGGDITLLLLFGIAVILGIWH